MSDQLLEAIRSVDPAASARFDPLPDETLAAILAIDPQTPEAIAAPGGRTVAGRSAGRRGYRRLALAATAAIAITVGAALLLDGSSNRTFGPSEASAALRELSLAASAHTSSDPPLEPGEYYYRRTIGYGQVHESWTSRSGVSYLRNTPTKDGLAPPGSRTGELERSESGGQFAIFGGIEPLTYREMLELPRATDALYEWVRTHVQLSIPGDSRPPEPKAMFFAIREFLITTPVPADLRAALYDVAARLQGIELLGEVENERGVRGLGIGMWRTGGPGDDTVVETAEGVEIHQREDLIFNQRTGEIIGDRIVLNGKPDGQAVVETGIVNEPGERP